MKQKPCQVSNGFVKRFEKKVFVENKGFSVMKQNFAQK